MEGKGNMERLTERDKFGNADIIGVDSMDLQCNLGIDEFNKVTNALNKLAEYEELEERCCKDNSWGLKMLTEKWKEFIEDIQELYEYRKAEEQNRLLKLPYAINDTVYYLDDITPFEEMPIEGRISGFRVTWCRTIVIHITTNFNDEGCLADRNEDIDVVAEEFGKTVFLTREEGEAALKELERGKGE